VPHVAFAKSAGEMPVFKRMIQVITRIILAAIVSNPFVPGSVHVRSFGVPRLVGESLMLGWRRCVCLGCASRSRTVRRNMSATHSLNASSTMFAAMLLRQPWQREEC